MIWYNTQRGKEQSTPHTCIVVIGAVLIIALALIFTRSDNDTTTETANENTITETEQQPEPVPTPDPQPTPTPTPSPAPDPQPAPQPIPTPNPQPGVLPADWDNLTPQEKTDLNPFNCDHEIQWVSAEDGTCIDKPAPEAATAPLQYLDHFVSCNPGNVSERKCDVFIEVRFLSTIDLEQAVSNPSSLPPLMQEIIINDNGACSLQFAPEFATLSEGQIQSSSYLIGVWLTTNCIEAFGALEQGIEQYITITMTGISEGVSLNLKTTPETTLTLTDFEIEYPVTPSTE